MSFSLNFGGKVARVEGTFARCEARMEKVSADDFNDEAGM